MEVGGLSIFALPLWIGGLWKYKVTYQYLTISDFVLSSWSHTYSWWNYIFWTLIFQHWHSYFFCTISLFLTNSFFYLLIWSLVCCFYYYCVCVFAMDNNEFMIVVGTIVLLIELFLHIWESPKLSTIFTFWFQTFNVQTLIANVFLHNFHLWCNLITLTLNFGLWIKS